MEPRMKVGTVEEIKSLLMDFILQEKAASNDPVFLIGGDMNKKDIVGAFDNYVDIIEVDHGPTRNGEKLDKTYTNFAADITTSKIYPPLQTELGLPSDHSCAVSRFLYKSRRRFTWTKIKLRKKTKEGNDMFGHLLEEEDWTKLYQGDTCPSAMVDKLHAKFGEWMNVCYPFKTLRRRSNEHPWITNYIRKKIRMKMRVFKREGRSRKWIDKEVKMLIRRSKQEYVGKAVHKCKDTGSNSTYYRVVKELNTRPWAVGHVYPGEEDNEVAEHVIQYFGADDDDRSVLSFPFPLLSLDSDVFLILICPLPMSLTVWLPTLHHSIANFSCETILHNG